ncbi:HD domain-containing protein [Inquilinus limosus]|uniref:HD domain-containing protein n=1 Tax=Inquilinus limosus TaxID=171674 RepID=UPI003F189D1A
MKDQRIRDPLHDLIEFSRHSELERALWKVIQTRPFQRLRRIKQLGFSDMIYPGASHSRFAHSIGVFHTARQLMEIVVRHKEARSQTRENHALAAALVHDLGHGPFSHAFETVGKKLGLALAEHEEMSERVIRDSEVTKVFDEEMGKGFAGEVADLIRKRGKQTVYTAVVSSQFDADRLDYMQRDRLMTGTRHAGIDFNWLIANLEIASVRTGVDRTSVGEVETFVLGPKAIHAAEAFVLGLFQLYPTVYLHKTTRGAERLFTELLVQVVHLVRDDAVDAVGLPANHPMIRFARQPNDLETALKLDDTAVWGALSQMTDASDPLISDFSRRLRDRDLYRCIDIRVIVTHKLNPRGKDDDLLRQQVERCCTNIRNRIEESILNNTSTLPAILLDEAKRSPYKSSEEVEGPLDRINIRTDGGNLVDLRERSSVARSLETYKLFRAYIGRDDTETSDTVMKIIGEEVSACRS